MPRLQPSKRIERSIRMKRILVVLMLVSSTVFSQTRGLPRWLQPKTGAQIEPNAGNWRTWVISSGKDYRVTPPPNDAQTDAELRTLEDLSSRNDAQARQQIEFWDAGDPAYT